MIILMMMTMVMLMVYSLVISSMFNEKQQDKQTWICCLDFVFLHHYPQMSIAWVCIHEKSFAHLWTLLTCFLRANIYCSGRWVGGVGPSWQKEICQVVWSLTKEGISLLTRMDSLLVAPIYMTTIIVVVTMVMMMSIVKLSSSSPSSWWRWTWNYHHCYTIIIVTMMSIVIRKVITGLV